MPAAEAGVIFCWTGADGLEQYIGQSLTVSIDADDTWWPSDTSLPMGQPRTSDVNVLQ